VTSLKELFLLDPSIIFLNHGSFGACPRPVFEAYQECQRLLESQPVRFLGREFNPRMHQARVALGVYLHADPDDLVFVPNATHAVNIVARSLELGPGDEILTSDHEYGACNNAWEFICLKSGANYLHQPIPLPATSPEEILELLWRGVTPRTRIIFLSHISSPTALRFPVEQVCRRARQAGILTLIDGAHAPGQISADMQAIGADFYTGNCHKWMMAPKGAGFLYTRRERQSLVQPLIVSWGYSADEKMTTGSQYVDYLEWTGTKDPSAALTVPAAIQFMKEYCWEDIRQGCHELLRQALQRIHDLTGLPPVYADGYDFNSQMAVVPIPPVANPGKLKSQLYDEFRIEIPVIEWNRRQFLRISVQGYNSQADIDALVSAVEGLLPTMGN
jgi:isopenicillin-N epimerase